MNPTEKTPLTDADYRVSHIEKGDYYDAALEGSAFDKYMADWEKIYIPKIIHNLFPTGLNRYLDFACGTGRITEQIAPLANHSTAVDISPTMMAVARKKCPATRFHLGDITKEDPDLGQFDLVSSFRFFGNAQDELRDVALHAITKRLAPNGRLLINSHRNPRALYALLDRLTGGTSGNMDLHLGKLRILLDRHGLEIESLQPIGAWMYRSRIMNLTTSDSPQAIRNEHRFGGAAFASIAPNVILVVRKLDSPGTY